MKWHLWKYPESYKKSWVAAGRPNSADVMGILNSRRGTGWAGRQALGHRLSWEGGWAVRGGREADKAGGRRLRDANVDFATWSPSQGSAAHLRCVLPKTLCRKYENKVFHVNHRSKTSESPKPRDAHLGPHPTHTAASGCRLQDKLHSFHIGKTRGSLNRHSLSKSVWSSHVRTKRKQVGWNLTAREAPWGELWPGIQEDLGTLSSGPSVAAGHWPLSASASLSVMDGHWCRTPPSHFQLAGLSLEVRMVKGCNRRVSNRDAKQCRGRWERTSASHWGPRGVWVHSAPGSSSEVQGEMPRGTWAGMEEDSTSW